VALTPVAVYCPHPLVPAQGRELVFTPLAPRETLAAYLERIGILTRLGPRPAVVAINGVIVPRAWWPHVRPKPGALITVQTALAGRGGGKNPIASVLSIALMVAAPYAAAGLHSVLWNAGIRLGTLGLNLLQGAVSLVGGLVINALFPPPRPQLSAAARLDRQESPTYSLAGGTNRARPYEPLPAIMGRHRVYPDLGAQPYTEFQGEDQYLYQIFDFGYNDVELSDYRIGTTPLTEFEGVEMEVSDASGALTLFPSNVDTTAGAALTQAAGWVSRTSGLNATQLAVEITGQLFYVGDAGTVPLGCVLHLQFRAVGAPDWTDLAFTSDAAAAVAGTGGFDHGVVRLTVEEWAQQSGVGPGRIHIVHGARRPLRRTYAWHVAPGQYEVRVMRVTADETDPRANSEIVWSQLRTYQPDTADYTGRLRVAIKIKASGQLQGTLDRFSVLARARTEVWDGSAWVTQHTANPAWWLRKAALGHFAGGRRRWGGGIAPSRLNHTNLIAFAQWCEDKGLTFNAVFDQQLSVMEMLDAIALRGRATTSWGSGQLEAVWDAPDQPAVAVVSMSNILRDSFEVQYTTSRELADEVVASFVSAERDYERDTVRVLAPGVTTPLRTRQIELFGCDNVHEAAQSANLYLAQNLYRARRYRWRMDWEAMPFARGDVVLFSHDLASYDYSGRLIEGSTSTVLRLERAVPLDPAGSWVTLVRPDGSFSTHAVAPGTGQSATLTLSEPLPYHPGADPDHPPYDYRWLYGFTAIPGRKVKIESIRPVTAEVVEITAVDDTPEYYAAENGEFAYAPPPVFLADYPAITDLRCTEELLRVGEGFAVRLTLTWDVIGTYDHANIRIGIAGAPRELVAEARGRRYETIVHDEGDAVIEVTAVHPLFGPGPQSRATLHYTILGKTAPPSDVMGLGVEFTATDTTLFWREIPDADRSEYEVRRGTNWDVAELVGVSRTTTLRVGALAAPATFLVRARDTSGNLSVNAAALTVTPTPPGVVSPAAAIDGPDIVLTWSPPSAGSYAVARYEVRFGPSFETATFAGAVDGTVFRARAAWSGERLWWVRAIDAAGALGAAGVASAIVIPPAPPAVIAEVIDNNVLLRWSDARQTLPIAHYEVRRGAEFASATVIGVIQSRFAVIFETVAGQYGYWVAGVDTAGNTGAAGNILATVDQPPDYVLFDLIDADFSGAKSNALAVDGRLMVMTDPDLSYDDSFATESWTSWQDAIDAGFPIYMQPGTTSAQYVEEIDYGAVLPATKVTVDLTTTPISGSVTVTPTISVRKLDTDPWTDFVAQWSVYGTDFRYVRVTLDFSGAGRHDLMFVDRMVMRLDVKLKSDAGTVTADANDAGGTTVPFNVDFIDVLSITATARGTTPAHVVVDFADVPHPTEFKVLVFDLAGDRITREVSWGATGV
jgi:sulfur carrier protein ThiS